MLATHIVSLTAFLKSFQLKSVCTGVCDYHFETMYKYPLRTPTRVSGAHTYCQNRAAAISGTATLCKLTATIKFTAEGHACCNSIQYLNRASSVLPLSCPSEDELGSSPSFDARITIPAPTEGTITRRTTQMAINVVVFILCLTGPFDNVFPRTNMILGMKAPDNKVSVDVITVNGASSEKNACCNGLMNPMITPIDIAVQANS